MESHQKIQTDKTILAKPEQKQRQAGQALLKTRITAIYTSNNRAKQPELPE